MLIVHIENLESDAAMEALGLFMLLFGIGTLMFLIGFGLFMYQKAKKKII